MNTPPSKKSKAISSKKGIMVLKHLLLSIRGATTPQAATPNTKKKVAVSKKDSEKGMVVEMVITTTTSKAANHNKATINSRVAVAGSHIREQSISEQINTIQIYNDLIN